jgi:hypothetical protein
LHHTSSYKQISTTNKKQYTKQCKKTKQGYKMDRMGARIDENGVKTEKLWLKHGSRGLI